MGIGKLNSICSTEFDCAAYLEQLRWRGKPICPYCKSDRTSRLIKKRRHHCNNCNTTFSVTVGTIFHHTHIPLQKWFLAIFLTLDAERSISARQLARDLEVTKDTAWSLRSRIRKAVMESEQRDLLHAIVEMNRAYIDGKSCDENSCEIAQKPSTDTILE